MADTTFVDSVTVIEADWLNEINDFYHTLFNAATTAAAARSAISAAASGANSDITSLTGLTTDLAVAHGGTGASAAAAARTNLSAQEDVITTRGDVIRGDSSGDAERLSLGADNTVLASDGTDASWETFQSLQGATFGQTAFEVEDASLSVSTSTTTYGDFTVVTYNPGSHFNTTSDHYVVPSTGMYIFSATYALTAVLDATAVYGNWSINTGGGFVDETQIMESTGFGHTPFVSWSAIRYMTSGDLIKPAIWHNSGTTETATNFRFSGMRLA